MARGIAGLLVASTLQVVALVLAHELVFLARYGSRYGEALVHSGHGETWSAAVTTSLALGGVLAIAGILRLGHLGLLVRSARDRAPDRRETMAGALDRRSLLRKWLLAGARVALLNVGLLTLQENLEHAAIGGTTPGAGILLTPEYAGGLWITMAIGLAVGLVAALFEWRRRVLLSRLGAARSAQPRLVTKAHTRTGALVEQPRTSIIGRRSALRAPPQVAAV